MDGWIVRQTDKQTKQEGTVSEEGEDIQKGKNQMRKWGRKEEEGGEVPSLSDFCGQCKLSLGVCQTPPRACSGFPRLDLGEAREL